jgi:tetratricopeptide (TPR) repeat protein
MAAVASLALGLVFSLWFYRQATNSLQQAQQQAQRAEAINDFLERDVLVASQLGRSRSGAALTMTDVLQRASERAAQRFKGQPELEAAVRLHLAQSLEAMHDFHAAAPEYQRALELWTPLRPPGDPQRLKTQLGLGTTLAKLWRKEEAKALLDEALLAASPAMRAARPDLDFAAEQAAHQTALGEGAFKQALVHAARMQHLADTAPGFVLTDRVNARLLQAELHYQLNDLAAAGRIVAELSAPPFGAGVVGPVLQARTLVQQARQQTNAGELAAAEATLLTARRTLLDNVGPTDYYLGIVASELADIQSSGNRLAQAAQSLAEAMVALKHSLGPDHPHVHTTAINKAFVDIGANQFASALRALDAERPWFAARQGDSARMLLQAIDFRRAIALTSLGRPAEALPVLDGIEPSALALASWGKDWAHKLNAERGRALLAAGRRTEGLPVLTQAVQAMRTECYVREACDGYARVLEEAKRARP